MHESPIHVTSFNVQCLYLHYLSCNAFSSSDGKPQATSGCSNLGDLAHGANGTLELGMELDAIKWTGDARLIGVDGRE